jgi:hypothetical protein
MNLNGFITFIGLLIAAYSILSKENRLTLKLKFGKFDLILAIIFFLAESYIFYLVLYDYDYIEIKKLNIAFHFNKNDPKYFAYLLIILFSLYICAKIKFSRLTRGKIKVFKQLTEEVLCRKEYYTFITLFESNLDKFMKIYNGNFRWERLKRWLKRLILEKLDPNNNIRKIISNLPKEQLAALVQDNPDISDANNHFIPQIQFIRWKVKKYLYQCFSKILTIEDKYADIANEMIRRYFLNKEIINQLINVSPYFIINLLKYDFPEKHDISNLYFYQMLDSKNSLLYYEIKNNQNVISHHRYRIDEQNHILEFLLSDCRVAENLGVWQPIGECTINYLDFLNKSSDDPYNYPIENFEKTCCESKLFVAISFFDIMVSEALYQNIQWHMWLYYFTYFTERICRNFKVLSHYYIEHAEFPNKYCLILYRIVSALRDWILAVDDIDPSQDNIKLQRIDSMHENGNIPKSSIIALTQCLENISSSKNIPNRQKEYYVDILISLYCDLKSSQKKHVGQYSDVIISCLKDQIVGYSSQFNLDFYKSLLNSYVKKDNTRYAIGNKRKATESFFNFLHEIAQSYLKEIITPNNYKEYFGKDAYFDNNKVIIRSRHSPEYTILDLSGE